MANDDVNLPTPRSQNVQSAFEEHYAVVLELAHARLRREQAAISTMTLAHELFLDLQHRKDLQFASREQFLGYVSRALRSLLVDLARERIAKKRSAELLSLTVGAAITGNAIGSPEALLALNSALDRLAAIDGRLARVVEMRALLGMELKDVAVALDVSEPTVKRDWQKAKAFLVDALATH